MRENLALQQLAALTRIPSDVSHGQLRLHPYWDPLRGDPRFEKLVASLAPPANKRSFLPASDNAKAADFLENKIARRYSALAMRNSFRP